MKTMDDVREDIDAEISLCESGIRAQITMIVGYKACLKITEAPSAKYHELISTSNHKIDALKEELVELKKQRDRV